MGPLFGKFRAICVGYYRITAFSCLARVIPSASPHLHDPVLPHISKLGSHDPDWAQEVEGHFQWLLVCTKSPKTAV